MATPLDSLGIVHETDVLILGAGSLRVRRGPFPPAATASACFWPIRANWKAAAPSAAATTISWRCWNTDAPGDTTETDRRLLLYADQRLFPQPGPAVGRRPCPR